LRERPMNALLALAPVKTWTVEDWIVFIVVLAAVIGVVYAALNYFGVTIPPVVTRIVLIVVVAVLAILAVRFLFATL
jgi:membrane protein YdbS with pleckstrin-like domain